MIYVEDVKNDRVYFKSKNLIFTILLIQFESQFCNINMNLIDYRPKN